MRLVRFTLLVVALSILFIKFLIPNGAGSLQPALGAQAALGTVSGLVVDVRGIGIPDAVVDLIQSSPVVLRTTNTDAGGAFQFARVQAGVYEVRATQAGVAPASVRVALVSGVALPAIRLTLGVPLADSRVPSGLRSVPGGIAGGVTGGIVGGLEAAPPPAAAPQSGYLQGPITQSARVAQPTAIMVAP